MSKQILNFEMVFDSDENQVNRFCVYEDYDTDDQKLIARFKTESEAR